MFAFLPRVYSRRSHRTPAHKHTHARERNQRVSPPAADGIVLYKNDVFIVLSLLFLGISIFGNVSP